MKIDTVRENTVFILCLAWNEPQILKKKKKRKEGERIDK